MASPTCCRCQQQALEIVAELPPSGLLFTMQQVARRSAASAKSQRVLDELIAEMLKASYSTTLKEIASVDASRFAALGSDGNGLTRD